MQACQHRMGHAGLFKNRPEHSEISEHGDGLAHIFRGVTGDRDHGSGGVCRSTANHVGRYIVGAKVDSVEATSQGDIGAGIDQEASRGCRLADNMKRLASQTFQVAGIQIFLAQLNEVDAAGGRFSNLAEKEFPAKDLRAGELGSVGDVAEQQCGPR